MQTDDSLLPIEKRRSKHLKEKLAWYLYYQLHYAVVCDEFKFMDIFAVRKNGYQVEFEIKVSKSDFDRELRCITADDCEKYGKNWEKFIKHRFYLTGKFPKTDYDRRLEDLGISTNERKILRPNEFNFYVPDYLADYAASKVKNLPYGVVKIGKYNTPNGKFSYSAYTIVKKPTKIHTEKCSPTTYFDLAHALTIRGRLFQ